MKRILITGGAGYIGSVLSRKLIDLGHAVAILDAFFFTNIGIREFKSHPALSIFAGDLRDLELLKTSLAGVDCVVHLAALANDPSAALHPDLTRQINLDSYPALLSEAVKAGVERFINISSIAVYGINFSEAVTEAAPLNPLTEYASCKAKGEIIVEQFNRDGFTTVNLRSGTVCGWSPRMRLDLCANTLTSLAVVDQELQVWGGDQHRPQIHIDDLTDFIAGLIIVSPAQIGGQVFNVAGENTTVMQVAKTIRAAMKGELTLTNMPPRDDERTYRVSSEKITRELGFRPQKTISDAVNDIINAYYAGFWQNPHDPLYHNVERMKSMECAFL